HQWQLVTVHHLTLQPVLHSNHSIGRTLSMSTPRRRNQLVAGSVSYCVSPEALRSIQSRPRPSRARRTSHATSGTTVSNVSASRVASVWLSITSPISVFNSCERGSKLKEPTNPQR